MQSQWAASLVTSGGDSVPQEGTVSSQSCSMKEGATMEQMMIADAKMNALAEKVGITGGMLRWFPLGGQSSSFADDYPQVTSNSSLAERGKNYDRAIKGGMRQAYASIYGELVECQGGSTSLYVSVGGKED